MNAPETDGSKVRSAESFRSAAPRDPGDVRTLLLALGAAALVVYMLRSILLPFVVAGIIAYICTPLVNWLTRRTGAPRALLALSMCLLLIVLIGVLVAVGGKTLVAEAIDTAADLQATIERIAGQAGGDAPLHVFGQTIDAEALAKSMLDHIRDWLTQSDGFAMIAGYALAAIMGLFLTAALLCYFLVGGPGVARGLMWTVPPSRRALVAQIGARLDPVLKRYFLGMLAVVAYVTTAAYVGLGLVLHVEHALMLAVLTGILETIPIIGSTSAAVIAGLVSLHTATGYSSVVAFALYVVILRLTNDQIVAPLVLGGAAHVHPALIIFCFFAGAVLLGIPGVIMAVPTALAVKTTLATLYGE